MVQPPWTHDRRRALRVDVRSQAGVDAHRVGSELPVELLQISSSGIQVRGNDALEPDSAYDICLAVDGHPVLTLQGRIVHSRAMLGLDAEERVRFVSAVQFQGVSDEQQRELARIVASFDDTGGARKEQP